MKSGWIQVPQPLSKAILLPSQPKPYCGPCRACCYCDAACQRKQGLARHKRAHRDLLLQQQMQMQQRVHLQQQQQQHDAPSAAGRAFAEAPTEVRRQGTANLEGEIATISR